MKISLKRTFSRYNGHMLPFANSKVPSMKKTIKGEVITIIKQKLTRLFKIGHKTPTIFKIKSTQNTNV
jgi:hypothetical protein